MSVYKDSRERTARYGARIDCVFKILQSLITTTTDIDTFANSIEAFGLFRDLRVLWANKGFTIGTEWIQ